MARLIVTAIAEDLNAAPGNVSNCHLIVSVTDANGVPVLALAAGNFTITANLVPPGGSSTVLASVAGGGANGVYLLQLNNSGGAAWKAGVYIWTVAVVSGANQGQVLTSVLMD